MKAWRRIHRMNKLPLSFDVGDEGLETHSPREVGDKSCYLAAHGCQPDSSLSEQLNNLSAPLGCPFDGLCVSPGPHSAEAGQVFGRVRQGPLRERQRRLQDAFSPLPPWSSGLLKLLFGIFFSRFTSKRALSAGSLELCTAMRLFGSLSGVEQASADMVRLLDAGGQPS